MVRTDAEVGVDTALQQLAVDLLVSCARVTRMAAALPGSTVPRPLWRLLGLLEQRGPSRISDLAAADQCSQPTMTGIVRQLADRGWVRRSTDPADGRAVVVSLTTAGRRALASARAHVGVAMAPRLAALAPEDRARLAAALPVLHDLVY
jgi:DNA-binding MarR family transcriptional regulator